MLQQIGEALAVDHAVFEGRWRRDSVCQVPRVWARPGSRLTRAAAMTAPALAEGRCLGELSVGLTEDGVPWPPQVEEPLSVLAGLIAIADRCRDGVRAARRPAADGDTPRVPGAETADVDGDDFEEISDCAPSAPRTDRRHSAAGVVFRQPPRASNRRF